MHPARKNWQQKPRRIDLAQLMRFRPPMPLCYHPNMRLAILADIHGNRVAFDAALAHARSQHPDKIILAGDIVVGSPDSADCWQRAISLNVPILRGNHERYVAEFSPSQANDEQLAPIRWAAAQFKPDE